MKKIDNCFVCNKTEFTEHITSNDFSVSKEEFTIVKCSNCDFHFTNPRPIDEEIGKYYISDHYISHNNILQSVQQQLHLILPLKQIGK